MADVLVLAELARGRVRGTTLSAITAAQNACRSVSCGFSILLLGHELAESARALDSYGADRVMVCDHPSLRNYVAEYFVPTAASVAAGFALTVATASSFGKDLVPRMAARLGAAYAGDCSGILFEDKRLVFERPMYAGNLLGQCTLRTAIQTATVRQSDFPPASPIPEAAPSPIENVPFAAPGTGAQRIEYLSYSEVQSERPDLGEARVVVAGGRPLGSRFFELLGPLAHELGAAIGATRAACDGGHAPIDLQVGQTGKVVAPELYLAVGVSGALQHLAGMRNARFIAAINRDPEAPIFQVADYGLVADLFEAMPVLTRAIEDWRHRQ